MTCTGNAVDAKRRLALRAVTACCKNGVTGSVARFSSTILLVLISCIVASGDERPTPDDVTFARVAVKAIPPFVYTDQVSPTGFSIDLWNSIAATINLRTEFVVLQTVADIIDAVEQGRADAGIAAVTINAEREARVDFSHAFYRSGLRIAAPVRSGPTWIMSFRRFLSPDLLATLLMLVCLTLIAAHLLWFMERRVNPACFPAGYFHGVGEAVWWSLTTIITGGCENKAPVSLLGRLVAVAWMLGSIILIASFTATLSSQMTAETVTGAITGPDDLPGRLVATVAKTSAAIDLRKRNARVRECQNLSAALKEVAEGRVDAVVFDAPVLAHAVNGEWNQRVRLIGPLFEHQNYGIVVPRDSPLRKAVNQALLKLMEGDTVEELNEKWFGQRE